MSTGPLAGLRIAEFAGIGPGPFAGMLLADMGAEVVRIQRPGGADPYAPGLATRGRTVVEADLKDAGARTQVLALLDGADALIEGFRPGVMERLGLGPAVVLARNPRLVYGRMTGWGQDGPLAATAGHDISYIAVTGALAAIGEPARPVPPLNLVGDYGGGSLYLVAGLLAGILSARATGRGQVVDAAICDGTASLMAMFCDMASRGTWRDGRGGNLLDGGRPYYRTYACRDGEHVAIGPLEPQFHAEFLRLTGLADDPDFARRDDPEIQPRLHARLEALFLTRSRDEWDRLFEGSDVCFAPVLSLSEAPHHPHLRARGTYVAAGEGGWQPAPAPRFSATPGAVRAPRAATIEAVAAAWLSA
ncbi:MAG: CaiB/BaiF CoA-transferase family protein [Methylobacterium frigidaeris]